MVNFFVVFFLILFLIAIAVLRNSTSYSEKDLLILASQGCKESFTQLFEIYKDKLYSFVLGLIKSEADAIDMVQDIFMKLWMNRAHLAEIENFGGYIFRAAKNQVINAAKKSIHETLFLKEMMVNEPFLSNQIESDLDYKKLEQRLNGIVKDLPQQQRSVFKLSREHGMRHEDIALELNISTNTVKNHMAQALKTIKKVFEL